MSAGKSIVDKVASGVGSSIIFRDLLYSVRIASEKHEQMRKKPGIITVGTFSAQFIIVEAG